VSALRRIVLVVVVGGLIQAARAATIAPDVRVQAAVVVLGIGFALIASWFVGKVFASIGLPKLTGYLATGMVAGPAVLGYLDEGVIGGLAPVNGVATALIALTAGSELNLRAMRPLLRSIGWISMLAVCGTALALGGTVFLLRPWLPFVAAHGTAGAIAISMTLGVVIVAQSPAVVVAIRSETGADGPVSRTVLGVVVLADLLVIVLFAVASALTSSVLAGSFDAGAVGRHIAWELLGSLGVGTVIGMILALYLRLIDQGVDLFVLAVCLVAAEVGRRLQLDPLLLMIAAGMFVENVLGAGERLRHAFEAASLPVYILFFTVAGASIHLDLLPLVAIPAGVLVLVRGLGLYAGTVTAARIANAPPAVARWAGFGLLPQAGLAIALALLFARTFPSFGAEASVLTLGIVAINELLAPAFFRAALVRSGEAKLADGARGSVPPPPPSGSVSLEIPAATTET
jgi:Kef-type K+ transport system membrane component KefB